MPPVVVYLDTNQILEILLKGRKYSEAIKVFNMISGGAFRVVIPQIVIGETVTKLIQIFPDKEGFADSMARLRALLYKFGIDPEECLESFGPEVGKIMHGMGGDVYLKGNDLALAAQVLADPDSAYLVTRDRVMLRSRTIADYEIMMREGGLRNVKLRIVDTL